MGLLKEFQRAGLSGSCAKSLMLGTNLRGTHQSLKAFLWRLQKFQTCRMIFLRLKGQGTRQCISRAN